jgi:peptide/nickel transport system permease protein
VIAVAKPARVALRQAWSRPSARIGIVVLLALVAAAVALPPLLADPLAQPDILSGTLLPPGAGHLFGTDALSRDVLARTVWGARVSLSVAALSVLLSITLGAAVGVLAGAAGGAVDAVLMRAVDAALAAPRLFLLLLVLAVWDRVPLAALVILIGATGWFGVARLVRGEVLRIREEGYVAAARALGAGRARVIFRHLLPGTAAPLLVAATLGVGDVILLEAGLSFLGLGVRPPTPSWGAMILESRDVLVPAPWTGFFPGCAIALTVIAVNLVGDALSDAADLRGA